MGRESVLIVHSSSDVCASLRNVLGRRSVTCVGDPVSAKEAVRQRSFDIVVAEHPFMGMEAPVLIAMLKGAGANVPFLVISEKMREGDRAELEERLGSPHTVLATVEPVAVAVAINRVEPTAPGGVLGSPPVSVPSPDDQWFLSRLGDEYLGLKVDEDSYDQWVAFDLPPQLIALLDGTRSAAQVMAESALEPTATLGYLRWLYMAECLEVGRTEARPPEVGWSPPEPTSPPDEQASLSDIAVPELVLGLRRRRETGQIIVETGEWSLRLDLSHGAVVRASGGPSETALGRVLMKLGHVEAQAHERLLHEYQARCVERPALTLGDVAIQMGLVSPSQVHAALVAQIEPKVHALVPLTSGRCRFYRDDTSAAWEGIESKPVETLMAEGLRRNEARRNELVGTFLERDGASRVRTLPATMEMLPLFHFGPRVQRFLRGVEGRTVAECLQHCPIPREEAETALYLLWAAGGLELELS